MLACTGLGRGGSGFSTAATAPDVTTDCANADASNDCAAFHGFTDADGAEVPAFTSGLRRDAIRRDAIAVTADAAASLASGASAGAAPPAPCAKSTGFAIAGASGLVSPDANAVTVTARVVSPDAASAAEDDAASVASASSAAADDDAAA